MSARQWKTMYASMIIITLIWIMNEKKTNCKVIFQPNLVYEFCRSFASDASIAVAAPLFQLYGCLVNVKQQRAHAAGACVCVCLRLRI